jgi:two-component system, chemotaxis family, sensor kinase CheA
VASDNEHRSKEEFLAEAEDILEDLNQQLILLEGMVDGGSIDPDIVNAIFRGVHSLKGLSGMFGFEGISGLSHQLEYLLDALRLGKLDITKDVTTTIFNALDRLKELSEEIGKAGSESIEVSDVVAMIEGALAGGGAAEKRSLIDDLMIDKEVVSVLTEYEEHRLKENIKAKNNICMVKATFELATFDKDLTTLNDRLKSIGEIISTLPSSGMSPGGIEFNLLVGSKDPVEDVKAKVESERVEVREIKYKADEKKVEAAAPSLRSLSKTVRVDIGRLDRLMNIVGELVLSKNIISQIGKELKGAQGFTGLAVDLHKASRTLERKLGELQEGVIEVRMVPIGQIFTRLAQAVRKYAGEVGKEIELETLGEDTELDKLMVEDMSDPLMHLIRNSIDHGVETPAERSRRGKPQKGHIRLNAFPKGNRVVITVEDDGAGIDHEKVRRVAVSKGLLEEAEVLSKREMLDLVFLPGFSTKENVSEVSGRGVGMDVVKKNVSKLSGMIDVDTEIGVGTTFTITLPITLAIIKALIVEVSTETFAVPLSSVLESLMITRDKIETIERREIISLRGETLPLLRMDRVFRLPHMEEGEFLYVVVVGVAERRLGLVVDRLVGQQEIVIKSIGEKLKGVTGIAGATELGDNEVVLVMDVEALIDEATMRR